MSIIKGNLLYKLFYGVLFFITFINTQKCKKYVCGSLSENLCLVENSSISPTTITGQLCKDSTQYCPTRNFDEERKSNCIEAPKNKISQYPGGPCESASDCLSGVCTLNICQGKNDGDVCEDHDNCGFNRACYKIENAKAKTCNVLKTLESPCESDYECALNAGCFQGFCKPYFSFGNEVDVSSTKLNNFYSFCKSGYAMSGFCQTLKNLDDNGNPSDDPIKCNLKNECNYLLSNGTKIILNDVCDSCGKSKDGFIYCPIFGGANLFQRYVDYMNKTLSSDAFKFCNTVERRGSCNYHSRNIDQFKELIQTIATYELRQKDYQNYVNADDCIMNIFKSDYNSKIDNPIDPVPTDEKKCPIFRCNNTDSSKEKICANTNFNTTSKRLDVALFSKSCIWDKELCNFNKDFNSTLGSTSSCVTKPKVAKRYPGEPCDTDDDCYAKEKTGNLGVCANKTKVCLGYDENENCASTDQCNKGLYCKKGEQQSTCRRQLAKDLACENSYDCANNLGCYNITACKDIFYSLNVGEEITEVYDAIIPKENFCKTRLVVHGKDGKFRCASRNHTDVKNSSISDLVRCEFNKMCNYTISDNVTSHDDYSVCECGYNSNGYGYCPRGHDANVDSWNSLYKGLINSLNNKCHSYSRFDCDDVVYSKELRGLKKNSEKSHLFFDAVSCANTVLSSKMIKISIGFLGLLLFVLLF